MMGQRGRPRKFSNAAEKQQDYRARKKADEKRIEQALALLCEVEKNENALRKSVAYYEQKGREVEIYQSDFGHAKWSVPGYVTNSINELVVSHMLRTGALVVVRKDWSGRYLALNEKTE